MALKVTKWGSDKASDLTNSGVNGHWMYFYAKTVNLRHFIISTNLSKDP